MTSNDNISRRSFLKATGGAASAAALAGCPLTPGGSQDDEQQPTGGTLELINSQMTTLDPIKATDTASGTVIQQVFDALTNYENGETAVSNLIAEGFERSEDFTTYTFTLKDGVQFHGDNGQVTAQDFVYAWERLAASPNSNRAYFVLDSMGVTHETDDEGGYVRDSLGVTAVDDTTLEIELSQPFHSTLQMLAYTAFAAVPDGVVGAPSDEVTENDEGQQVSSDNHSEFATQNPVGAGPFELETFAPGDEASVTAFDDYHGDGPLLDGVHWAVIEDDQAAYNYSMNENADLLSIPTANYEPDSVNIEETDERDRGVGTYGPVRNGQTVNYLRVPTVSTYYFGFNTDLVPKPVRQAVAYASNQEEFANQVFKQRVEPGYHLTPPLIYPGGKSAYDQHAQENYPYGYNEVQIEEAQRVMEEAGYGPDNQFELQWTQYVSDTWRQIAQILRDRLSTAYIDMSIEEAQFATLLQRGRQGNLACYTLGWIADWPAPDNFLQLLYPPRTDTSQPGPLSYSNWSGTEAAQTANDAYQTVLDNRQPTDSAESTRDDAYVRHEEANWEDAVFINTFHGVAERFWYDRVDVPKHGAMGGSRQMYNQVTKEQSDEE